MTTPRPSDRPGAWPPDGDPAMDVMRDYLSVTDIRPAPELTARVQARIAREPDRTPPRRYLLALLRIRPGLAAAAFRQLLAVIGRGSVSASIRFQALGLVLVTVLAMLSIAIASAIGVQGLLDDRVDHPVPPTLPMPSQRADLHDRSTAPSVGPSDRPAPVSPSPVVVSPGPTDRREGPARTARPTLADEDGGPDRAATPRPTRRPTQHPRSTQRADPTDRPTHRPQRTERPDETEAPATDDGGDDHGDGGHEGPDGGDETEPPDATGMRPLWAA